MTAPSSVLPTARLQSTFSSPFTYEADIAILFYSTMKLRIKGRRSDLPVQASDSGLANCVMRVRPQRSDNSSMARSLAV